MQVSVESYKKILSDRSVYESTTMKTRRKGLKVRDFNDVISCYLCNGYMINPTTVDNCLHSYCRSCIVQHLLNASFCPQCKSSDGKQITVSNLKPDDVLRTFIFKLVPGLYQEERERIVQFTAGISTAQQQLEEKNKCRELELEEDLFLPAEPISLSLEYHPALSKEVDLDHVPPVRYLQCPASLKIFHLKRFLCSKYDIDPDNKRIEVEVIYEEEVLPNDFTLMDVGYCYNWKRHAPMEFRYRILLHSGEEQMDENCQSKVNEVCIQSDQSLRKLESITSQIDKANSNAKGKSVSFVNDNANVPPPPTSTKTTLKSESLTTSQSTVIGSSSSKTDASKTIEINESQVNTGMADMGGGFVKNAPVKVIIARKSADDSKRLSSKQSSSCEETTTYAITSDFKSLRSNDIRYSDYAVTSTTTTTNSSPSNTTARNPKPKSSSQQKSPEESPQVGGGGESAAVVPKCDIVVSIPHSQMPKSPYSFDEQFENVSLAQLKTASKKSPPNSSSVYEPVKKPKNVPKLKIELNSLKTKLTIPKPKSADVHHEDVDRKKPKYRKHSLDELGPTAYKVDLETYVKNIGLKPIEVLTPTESERELSEKVKFSPNASPMSSSSSTTSSSNGNNFVLTSSPKISSSVHKKRKKKHSNSKRRKLHAEISSQPADESLKMKVKITASHNHKAHKSESRKSEESSKSLAHIAKSSSSSESSLDSISLNVLNKTLREESNSINNLMKHKPDKLQPKDNAATDETNLKSSSSITTTSAKSYLVLKPISTIKDINKIPSSPPLPPSLFKTTALTLTTLTPATSTLTGPKLAASVKEQKVHEDSEESLLSTSACSFSSSQQHPKKSSTSIEKNTSSTTNMTTATNHKNQHFAVPNPPRPVSNIQRLFSAPSSIASAVNKQVGMQLKRSASLDESYSSATASKQKKIEHDRAMRKNAYASYVGSTHMNTTKHQNQHPHQSQASHKQQKMSIGSGVGRSFEMPFYSPMSKEYTKRKVASSMTPSSISICKVSDAPYNAHAQHNSMSGAVTITARQRPTTSQTQLNSMPYSQQHALNKPALEIVRITSNQIPVEMLPLPPLSTAKGNHHRLMGPPAPVAKSKKPGQQTVPLSLQAASFLKPQSSSSIPAPSGKHKSSSPSSTSGSTYRTSPPVLVNLHNIYPSKSCTNADSNSKKTEVGTKAGSDIADKPKLNLREFRPTSKDGSVDILDLSPGKIQEKLTAQPAKVFQAPSSPLSTPQSGNSLEAALNKIKQNISSCTVVCDNKHPTATKKLHNTENNSDDLQNLHLLSESATAREKIDIKSQLYEKQKLKQSSVVRQQNASVRNIPNPSALAFRNQPTTLPALSLSSASSTSPPQKKAHLPLSAAATAPTELVTTPSSPITPSPRSIMKKPTTIDQVATNLNIRAAAAEASAAKAASASEELEPVQVTSTSNSTNNNTEEKQRNSSKSCDTVDSSTTSISAAASAGSIKSSLLEANQLAKPCISNIATPNSDCASSVASSV